MSLVVVNLGLPKSGTTTLARALRLSGLRVADHRLRGRNAEDPALKGRFVADVLYEDYFATGNPVARLPMIEAISEMSMLSRDRSLWPQMDFALLMALRAHNPGVKFLAPRRDAFRMSQSFLAWTNLGLSRLPANAIPGLPPGFGKTTKERVQWIDGHYAALAQFFARDPDFLEFDIAAPEAPDLIAGFLGRDLPWWGRLNANPMLSEQKA